MLSRCISFTLRLCRCCCRLQVATPNLAAAVGAAAQHPQTLHLVQQAAELLEQLVAALPANSLLLVLSGQGNTALCRALHGEGGRRKEGGFAAQNVRHTAARGSPAVQGLVERAQRGVCLAAIGGRPHS
jgi:hypothetical protein